MSNIWNRTHFFFIEWIFCGINIIQLHFIGYCLQPNWVAGIADEAEVVRIYPRLKKIIQLFGNFFFDSELIDKLIY